MQQQINQQDILDDLKRAQGKHLRAIERWATQQPKVTGIPILQALTYELIQAANQAYLAHLLKDNEAQNG